MTEPEHEALLLEFTQHMRRAAQIPGMTTEQLAEVTRYSDPAGGEALILWHDFSAEEAPRIIAREVAHFHQTKEFIWNVYAEDRPENLAEMLIDAGMELPPYVNLTMVIQAARVPQPAANSGVQVRVLTKAEQIRDLIAVWEEVWPNENGAWPEILAGALVATPERLKVLVAYLENRPVAACYLVLTPGGKFGFLGGGATRAAYRKRGIYRALLAERARLALAHGTPYLSVEASPDSAPILKSLGFETLTSMRSFKRKSSPKAAV